ncbi:DUF4329 domain-containing protein [Ruegeria sp. 2205SS24-7]|uniref:DUF4329 domain-containing protein n=1 Tax=Ruegeria discodermiae TaxID=3064389 RepID=UPI00274044B4|nr:DUF4329 domain-containing protein [Ruegeria sp. 2205SS24-7]MDP5216234.1 DUF4329 domain-containing protein [Ruegeria sp. 2205SS24-7]
MPLIVFLLTLCFVLTGPNRAEAQYVDVTDLAYEMLGELQAVSFAENREFCGFIGEDLDGQLVISDPRRGGTDSCRPEYPPGTYVQPLASFHTHAAHDLAVDSEIPSSSDIVADMEDGVDGYVATPGGRFWFIDGIEGTARLLCGPGCLPQDPRYDPEDGAPVGDFYTLQELDIRETE